MVRGGAQQSSGPGVRGGGQQSLPGVRGGSAGTARGVRRPGDLNDKDMAAAEGHVLSDKVINGVHVRVSAPNAPNPGDHPNVINVEAKDSTGAASMVAGSPTEQQTPTRPAIQQLPPEKPVSAEAEERPKGSYWSDKYERFVAPGETEYSVETAQRMGIAV